MRERKRRIPRSKGKPNISSWCCFISSFPVEESPGSDVSKQTQLVKCVHTLFLFVFAQAGAIYRDEISPRIGGILPISNFDLCTKV